MKRDERFVKLEENGGGNNRFWNFFTEEHHIDIDVVVNVLAKEMVIMCREFGECSDVWFLVRPTRHQLDHTFLSEVKAGQFKQLPCKLHF